jgi:UPF0271 protein
MDDRNKIPAIDLNCDMGEGIGADASIMPYISSANIACGYHAGDEETMRKTIELAIKYKVAIGAHPSFPDRENFGRKEMQLSPSAIYELVIKQIDILHAIALSCGAGLHHVKPHGALYNVAAKDTEIAKAIAQAVKDCDKNLFLVGLSGSYSISEAKRIGLKTLSEVFADRTYMEDGNLTPRSHPNALIEETEKAVQQVLQIIKEKTVTTVSGKVIPIIAESVCIHGDGRQAVAFAKRIHAALQKEHIKIQSF